MIYKRVEKKKMPNIIIVCYVFVMTEHNFGKYELKLLLEQADSSGVIDGFAVFHLIQHEHQDDFTIALQLANIK
jgi:hypothetical protein